jgi:hypothetical protein
MEAGSSRILLRSKFTALNEDFKSDIVRNQTKQSADCPSAAAAAAALQGIRKTKLGLREFIKLGEFVQQIDTDNKLAVSIPHFLVPQPCPHAETPHQLPEACLADAQNRWGCRIWVSYQVLPCMHFHLMVLPGKLAVVTCLPAQCAPMLLASCKHPAVKSPTLLHSTYMCHDLLRCAAPPIDSYHTQLNVVQFSVAGLGMLSGSLTVKASYEVASDERVDIKFIESTLVGDPSGHSTGCVVP